MAVIVFATDLRGGGTSACIHCLNYSRRIQSPPTPYQDTPRARVIANLDPVELVRCFWSVVCGQHGKMANVFTMAGFYLKAYEALPDSLKHRIHPLEYGIQAFVRSARPRNSAVVLDAGAGEARFRHYFAEHLYIALDSAVGEKNWDYSRIHVCGDLTAIPLATGSAHTALNIQVLEHVADPAAVLKEIYRVLEPGGQLYLTAPQGWHEHQQPHDYFRFTRYSLKSLLNAAGFQEITVDPIGGYFHYLGHRLTYIPKILFEHREGLARILLLPLELMALGLFCVCGPVTCYYLDKLDRKKEFTLCYKCRATKPRSTNS